METETRISKLERKLGAICLCIFVIIFQVLRLLTWYLPPPHNIRLMLLLFSEPWFSLLNLSSILSMALAVGFVILTLMENGESDEETSRRRR